MGGSIKDSILKIKKIALSIFEEEKIADIILLERHTLSGTEISYIYSLKVDKDDVLSQKLYLAFMEHYHKTKELRPVKSQVLIENRSVKELFFLRTDTKEWGK